MPCMCCKRGMPRGTLRWNGPIVCPICSSLCGLKHCGEFTWSSIEVKEHLAPTCMYIHTCAPVFSFHVRSRGSDLLERRWNTTEDLLNRHRRRPFAVRIASTARPGHCIGHGVIIVLDCDATRRAYAPDPRTNKNTNVPRKKRQTLIIY